MVKEAQDIPAEESSRAKAEEQEWAWCSQGTTPCSKGVAWLRCVLVKAHARGGLTPPHAKWSAGS